MKKYLLVLLLCVGSSYAYADEEDWYTYWSIGMAEHNYPAGLNSLMDSIESLPGVDRTEIGIDMLGFYWPQENNSLLGVVISGSADSFESSFGDMQINHYLYGVSGMKFFGREIGDGFFIRADAGLARIVIVDDYWGTTASDTGFGYLLGAGFSIPISSESRVMFGVNFSDKQVEGDSWKSTTFTIGGLW